MSDTVLVAGASGVLGAEICAELRARGRRVIALVRSAERLQRRGVACDEVRIADALRPATLDGQLRGASAVISTLGASVAPSLTGGWAAYSRVDVPMNRALIECARTEGVRRFVYVSVHGAKSLAHIDYFGAHGTVEDILAGSGLSHAIIRPTGFFATMGELLRMAARGGALPRFGDGSARTNPIHEADLATVCVDALADGGPAIREVGGPETLTRREIAVLALAALGKSPRLIPAPVALIRFYATLLRPALPRMAELLRFVVHVMTHDTIAPAAGQRRLADYFAERVAARRN